MMRAVVWEKPGQVVVTDVPDPTPAHGPANWWCLANPHRARAATSMARTSSSVTSEKSEYQYSPL